MNRSYRTISAPYPRVAASFIAGVSRGITMVAETPSNRADSATACAWLPDENVITPAVRSAAVSCASALNAPRILKEPLR